MRIPSDKRHNRRVALHTVTYLLSTFFWKNHKKKRHCNYSAHKPRFQNCTAHFLSQNMFLYEVNCAFNKFGRGWSLPEVKMRTEESRKVPLLWNHNKQVWWKPGFLIIISEGDDAPFTCGCLLRLENDFQHVYSTGFMLASRNISVHLSANQFSRYLGKEAEVTLVQDISSRIGTLGKTFGCSWFYFIALFHIRLEGVWNSSNLFGHLVGGNPSPNSRGLTTIWSLNRFPTCCSSEPNLSTMCLCRGTQLHWLHPGYRPPTLQVNRSLAAATLALVNVHLCA